MLEQLSKVSGKSKNTILFEFMRDKHPRTFKEMMENEELKRTGKMTGTGCDTYISLVDEEFVEKPVPKL